MANLDAATIGQLAVRLNLISEDQRVEALDEVGSKTAPPEAMVRLLERKGWLSAYQGGKLAKGDTDGYFLGGYRLLYKIAAGTFGRVYRGDDPRTGSIVAIKVLRRRWAEEENNKVELFEREGKVGMTLKHPAIVEIFAVSRDPASGQYYIVMEFVEGGNLRDIMNIRKKLELPDALRVLEETSSGLAYAATRGLTHRDLKLSNILMSSAGHAKLVDFGLAEITGTATVEDKSGTVIDRTVDYAGLERATGVKKGDPRTDIFFLGCIFYELLMGVPLIEPTRDKHKAAAPRRFEVLEKLQVNTSHLPMSVRRLMEKMVAYEPFARFQSAAVLVEAVRQARAELEGATQGGLRLPAGPRSVYVAEAHPKLQDAFRDKLKEYGYRVLISADPSRAPQRYAQQPFHLFVVDIGTTGEAGVKSVAAVLEEADQMKLYCGVVAILNEDQSELTLRLPDRECVAALLRPLSIKQLRQKLRELLPEVGGDDGEGE